MEIDLKQFISFIESQKKIFEILPASDYSNGVIAGINIILNYLNHTGKD